MLGNGCGFELAPGLGSDAICGHETCDTRPAARKAPSVEFSGHSWTPVCLATLLMNDLDLFEQDFILACPFTRFTAQPLIVSTAADLKSTTQTEQSKLMSVFINELEFHLWGVEKMAKAFFNPEASGPVLPQRP